jgi:hypothetical protein
MANRCVAGLWKRSGLPGLADRDERTWEGPQSGGFLFVQSVCCSCDPWFPEKAFLVRGKSVGAWAGAMPLAGQPGREQ